MHILLIKLDQFQHFKTRQGGLLRFCGQTITLGLFHSRNQTDFYALKTPEFCPTSLLSGNFVMGQFCHLSPQIRYLAVILVAIDKFSGSLVVWLS